MERERYKVTKGKERKVDICLKRRGDHINWQWDKTYFSNRDLFHEADSKVFQHNTVGGSEEGENVLNKVVFTTRMMERKGKGESKQRMRLMRKLVIN